MPLHLDHCDDIQSKEGRYHSRFLLPAHFEATLNSDEYSAHQKMTDQEILIYFMSTYAFCPPPHVNKIATTICEAAPLAHGCGHSNGVVIKLEWHRYGTMRQCKTSPLP
jgi:hypothetical protein